jgi:hydrogenase maturation protein HypF
MARDLDEVRGICHLSPDEEAALASSTRPILLLRRREALPAEREVAHAVAPLHAFLGVMLPSAPLFSVLFEHGAPPLLVATSGNRSGAPLARTNEAAFRDLAGVADAFLVHDREIHNRCDDSVGYVASGESPGEVGRLVLLRRARGFAPLPLPLPSPVAPSLAVGAMLASTVALAEGHRVFPSQHLGDTDDLDTLEFLEEAVERLQRWLRIEPELLACDLHPDLPSTHLARRLAGSRPLHRVQHHHAHLAAAATAAGLRFDEEALALVLDGTGYGPDGAIWGCEALVGSAVLARRVGHLRPVRLPGGDHAIRRPRRVAAAWLHAALPGSEALPLRLWDAFEDDELAVLRRMMDRAFNAPWTTSAGRLFDAVAAILGFGGTVSYEGQAAVELEQAAWRASRPFPLPLPVEEKEGLWRLDPGPLLDALVRAVLRGEAREALAMGFHEALARALVELCRGLREGGAPDRVLLAGGVFQNRILTQRLLRLLREAGMRPLPPGTLPIGDGGLSVGQVAVANARGPGQPGVLVAESPVHPEAP